MDVPSHACRIPLTRDAVCCWLAGSKLINNTFIRIRNTEKTFLGSPAVQAIYFDDQLSAHFAIGNTIIDSHQGILLGGGRRHQVGARHAAACRVPEFTVPVCAPQIHNNRFINVPNAIAFDDRGLTWQKAYCSVGGTECFALRCAVLCVHRHSLLPAATCVQGCSRRSWRRCTIKAHRIAWSTPTCQTS